MNVAQLVGATGGYSGLNGIVVVMGKYIIHLEAQTYPSGARLYASDGLDFKDFIRGTHSGGAWAKCVRECPFSNYSQY